MEPEYGSVLRETKQLDFSGLPSLIRRYHSSKTAQNWQSYMLDLLSVASGVKCSWLIDYFSPNSEKLKACITEVFHCLNSQLTHEQRQLMPRCCQCLWCSTCIVSLNQDVLVCNVERVLALGRELADHQGGNSLQPAHSVGTEEGKVTSGSTRSQNTEPPKQVDCKFIVLSTSPEQAPHLASPTEEESILLQLQTVAELLLESLPLLDRQHTHLEQMTKDSSECQRGIQVVHVEVPPDINLCTVFGWLLGYPIVYWFPNVADSTSTSTHQSSLGLEMLPLLCYKIQCKHKNTEELNFCSSNLKGGVCSDLYSFSVPEKLISDRHVRPECVESWFDKLLKQAGQVFSLWGFTSPVLSVTTVCLPQVNL